MNKTLHSIVLKNKKHGAAIALCMVFGVSAWAQDGPPPLPPINLSTPALTPASDGSSVPPALPALPAVTSTPNAGLPSLPIMTEANLTQTDSTTPPPLADLPLPAPVAETSKAGDTKQADAGAPTLPSIATPEGLEPAKTAESASTSGIPPLTLAPPPLALNVPSLTGTKATALPEVSVSADDKPKEKTWETKLAPSREPLTTKFNYKRVLMPAPIYRADYEEYNKHLPTIVTRQDYEALLFERASQNDVVATRALINAGTNINVTDANGNTPLSIARRSGAYATTQLLIARGAHE